MSEGPPAEHGNLPPPPAQAGGAPPPPVAPTGAPPPPAGYAPPPPPGYPAPTQYVATPSVMTLPAGTQLSSQGKRLGAAFLDGGLMIVTAIIGWVVWSFIIYGRGQTPAKQLLKMRTVNVDEGRLATYGEMVLREFVVKFLLFSLVGSVFGGLAYLVGAGFVLSDTRQALWDRMLHTNIVDDPGDLLDPKHGYGSPAATQGF